MAKQALLIDEFIAREADKGRIRREAFTKESRNIKLHGHCHQKSLASLTSTVKALELPVNYKVQSFHRAAAVWPDRSVMKRSISRYQ